MEVHHDLRELIAETVVAQSCGVLSSGCGATGDISRRRMAVDPATAGPTRQKLLFAGTDRQIDTVKHLTTGVRIESFMQSGSDQTAAEALQEAETGVGVVGSVDRGANAAVRAAGQSCRSTNTAIGVGLTA